MRKIFTDLTIMNQKHWLNDRALVVEDGKIHSIIPKEMVANHLPATCHSFASTDRLVPGFIDLHVHGANGADIMDGTAESFVIVQKALASEGVTSFLATTMTAPPDQIEHVLASLAKHENGIGAQIAGIHLEGPFISGNRLGAQSPYQQLPDITLMKKWLNVSDQKIKLVTLAPELPGALQLIAMLAAQKIVVSTGHTTADFDTTVAAIQKGCSHATHWFNAMGVIAARDPGAVCALLLDENVYLELIVDHVHLHPAISECAFRIKKRDKLLLVTDAMRAKCLGDGTFELGGQKVFVQDGIARTKEGNLSGSTLTMPQAIKNIQSATGCTLLEAIEMASTNPAKHMGWRQKGVIEVGFDADFVVLDEGCSVKMTVANGEIIYEHSMPR